ncbi:MAG: [Eubacterium sp.]|nr:[FeFe] hydrogenase H-cluster maturation GTPase HydF [Eubacterium sp.]
MAEINETPSGMRTHIGFFGKTNSGKSSLINALAGQDVSIVSSEPGTTTDPVYKAVEISPIGPCLLIDTAGLEDETTLGGLREERTTKALEESDVVVLVLEPDSYIYSETIVKKLLEKIDDKVSVIPVITKTDSADSEAIDELKERIAADIGDLLDSMVYVSSQIGNGIDEAGMPYENIICVSSRTGDGINDLRKAIIDAVGCLPKQTVLQGMVTEGDIVMLVMPQDKQAPKGRLILPQVTTLRELLDVHARTICVAPEEMSSALSMLKEAPSLIITDSQVFDYVYERKPEESRLTSFSILFAGLKGDIAVFTEGAKAIDSLRPGSRILVAESCSHAPLEEDIGREKIPNLLRKKIGGEIIVDIAAGKDFPEDLSGYDLILQCGGCMVNRRQIMNRVNKAVSQGIPITNYGIAIAHLKGILDKVG